MSDLRIFGVQPLPRPQKRPTRLSALLVWFIAALGLLVSSLLSTALAPALSGLNAQARLLIANLIYYLPFVVLPVFLLARRTPGLYEAYRPNPISLFDVVSITVLAVLGLFFVNDITLIWSIPFEKLGLNPYSAGLPAAQNARELVLSVITVAVVPAVCEEFLFRGAILSAFEAHGTKHAMWVTSILFMMIHASFIGAPSELILGMILAFVVIWTDSIYAGLIYHTVHNAAAVVLEYLQTRSTADVDAVRARSTFEAIGGMAGVVELLLSIALSAALILLTLKLMRMRGRLRGVCIEARKKQALRGSEWIVLLLGALCCVLLYATDFIAMLGG